MGIFVEGKAAVTGHAILSERQRRAIEAELRPGERIVWASKSSPVRTALQTWPRVAFGAVFASIALFMLAQQFGWLATGGELIKRWDWSFDQLMLVAFIGIGLFDMSQPLRQLIAALGTLHCVTSDRLLTIHRGIGRSVTSFAGSDIKGVTRRDFDDESGTLRLDRGTKKDTEGDLMTVAEYWHGVANAKQAERAIHALQRSRF